MRRKEATSFVTQGRGVHFMRLRGAGFIWWYILMVVFSPFVARQGVRAEEKKVNGEGVTEKKALVEARGEEKREEKVSKTKHTLTIDGRKIHYSAVAGEIHIKKEGDGTQGSLFYIAYMVDNDKEGRRPLTFAFNGGPGAASVWLHLGGLGPKRVALNDDGRPLPPPVSYCDNPYTWLAFTDLVFVDPVGTGFSRSVPDDKDTSKKFYGVQQDMEAVADFIRLYLTRYTRWTSPLFLVGESYGTTRVSGLTWYLHQRYGIDLNGVVLISPVLDYDTILFHPSHDLPYLLFLPTYAATAWYHKVLPAHLQGKELEEVLEEVERFSLDEYNVLLAKGENLSGQEKKKLKERVTTYTGLIEDFVEAHHYRIHWVDFTKSLLEDRGLLVGRMDGTITGGYVQPAIPQPYPHYDPALDRLYGPFSTAINDYVRRELGFESDLFYEFLNSAVNSVWDWSTGVIREQGFVDVSHNLRDALAVSEHLKIFIAGGYYDLATPYFAVNYTVDHMWLGEQRNNIEMKCYRAGHMIFTHSEVLKQLFSDVKCFYHRTVTP